MSFALMSLAVACGGGGGDGGNIDTTPGTGTVQFMEVCDIEANDCDSSSFCYEYGEGAILCTRACDGDVDCASPSVGCNGKGICKRPGGAQ